MKAKDLDKLFDDGEEDVLQYFDVSKTRRINWEHELVELELPKERLAEKMTAPRIPPVAEHRSDMPRASPSLPERTRSFMS